MDDEVSMEKREICANCGIPDGELVGVVRRSTGERVYIHQWSCDKHLKSVLDAAREEIKGMREAIKDYLAVHEGPDIPMGDPMEEAKTNKSWCEKVNAARERLKAVAQGAGKEEHGEGRD